MTFQPELGQLAFGNPTGRFESPQWFAALVREILHEIERVFWNKHQREWNLHEDPQVPGIQFRPYYWGDDPEEAAKPNLAHAGVEVRWYKHPMRGASLNVPAAALSMVAWFESAMRAVHAWEGK